MNIFQAIPELDASYQVTSQATFYPEYVSLFIPHQPIQKISDGLELSTKKQSSRQKNLSIEDDVERSLRRTKKTIRDYVLCNYFDLFTTFTFSDNRYDVTEKRTQLHNWLRNQTKRVGTFGYLVVMEYHKDKAVHFHGVFKNYPGKLKESKSSRTGKLLTKNNKQVYEFPSFTLGFTNVQKINHEQESLSLTARYLTKYITKDMPTLEGKKRFWSSQGLLTPPTLDNPPDWFLDATPIWQTSSEFGTILHLSYSPKLTEYRELLVTTRGKRLA